MAAFRGYKVGLYYGNDQSGGVSLTGFSIILFSFCGIVLGTMAAA